MAAINISVPDKIDPEEREKSVNWFKLQRLLTQAGDLLRQRFREFWTRCGHNEWDSNRSANAKLFIAGFGKIICDKQKSIKIQRKHLKSGDLDQWDLPMFIDIFMDVQFGKSTNQNLKEDRRHLRNLKKVRNQVAHLPQTKISADNLETWWKETELAILYFGGSKERVESIKNSIYSTNVADLEGGQDFSSVDVENSKQAEAFKLEGNILYVDRKFQAAIEIYTNALELNGLSQVVRGILYSNRSAAYVGLAQQQGNSTEFAVKLALADSKRVVELRPAWYKGYFRMGNAYHVKRKYVKAVQAFEFALSLAPAFKEIQHACDEARRRLGIVNRADHLVASEVMLQYPSEEEVRKMTEEKWGRPVTTEELRLWDKYDEARIPGQADVNMGNKYYDGTRGVEQSYETAVVFYTKAKVAGNAEGIYRLAKMYELGKGVKQDFSMAIKLQKEAASKAPFRDNGEGVKEEVRGVMAAMHGLGLAYHEGVGVPQAYQEARPWYEKAAELGCAPSMNNLAFFYKDALGVPLDPMRAGEYWHLAATHNCPIAMESYALHCANIERDYAKARHWYDKAIASGNLHADLGREEFYERLQQMENDAERIEKVVAKWEASVGMRAGGLTLMERKERLNRARSSDVMNKGLKDVHDLDAGTMRGAWLSESEICASFLDTKMLSEYAEQGSKTAADLLRAVAHFTAVKNAWKKGYVPTICHELLECCRYAIEVINLLTAGEKTDLAELMYDTVKVMPSDDTPCELDREARICYLYLKTTEVKTKLRFAEASLKKYPNEKLLYNLVCNLHLYHEDAHSALQVAERGLELFPGDVGLLICRATAGSLTPDHELTSNKAIEAYKTFTEKAPKDHRFMPLAFYGVGFLYAGKEIKKSLDERDRSGALVVPDITMATKYFQRGLEAEKFQLPCYLPYKSSLKPVLQNMLSMASSVPPPDMMAEVGLQN